MPNLEVGKVGSGRERERLVHIVMKITAMEATFKTAKLRAKLGSTCRYADT